MDGYGIQDRVKNGPALAGHGAEAVKNATIEAVAFLPEKLRQTLTWDRGTEMAAHAEITRQTGLAVFFCDPHSPWQRGTNENTVSLGVAREGRSGRVVPAAKG
jgi:IS30 family transposase